MQERQVFRKFLKDGQVYSEFRKNLRRLSTTKSGYHRLTFRVTGNKKTVAYLVHRLVAEAYIPNPEGKATVNHKNGNKIDNRVENLEWATKKEQAQHAHDTGLNPTSKKVIQYSLGGKELARYKSTREAAKDVSVTADCIARVCNPNLSNKTGGRFIWKYL